MRNRPALKPERRPRPEGRREGQRTDGRDDSGSDGRDVSHPAGGATGRRDRRNGAIRMAVGAALLAVFAAPSGLVAQTDTAQTDTAQTDAAQSGAAEIGDVALGEKVFRRECAKCHQVGPEARHRVGPVLNGIFGQVAGRHEDFRYSKGMQRMHADGLTWTLETLDAYLTNPRALVSGTRMSFRGLKNDAERAGVLAYLRTFSDSPQDIPEAQPTAISNPPHVPPEVLAIVGDVEFGKYLASECQTCHRKDGTDEGIPSITGWPVEDFVVAMHAYRQKLRPHPVMQMMAGRLNDEEIAALAAYFSTLE